MTMRTGGCLCGHVRFEVIGPPKCTFHCHCWSCRRHTGAAMATFAGFRIASTFCWAKGTPATYVSSRGVTRRFCSRCGTPITYEAERLPDEVHIAIGTFDQPETPAPEFHVYLGEKIPWLETAEHLPRFAGSDSAA